MARQPGDYKKLPTRCGVDNCKTRLFYVEDGQWFCKFGHRREGDVELDLDDDFGIQMIKKVKRVEEKVVKKKIVWAGRKGFGLFLDCYQGILKAQVRWLIEKQGLPEELEEVVRDLWNLRLRGILEKQNIEVTAEGIAATQEGYSSQIDSSGYSTAYSSQMSDYESSHSQMSQFEIDHFSQKKREKRERRRKRRKMEGHWQEEVEKKRKKRLYKPPLLLEAVALCYLGIICLDQYVPIGDFKRWMESQDLLYFRATNAIPAEMKRHLHGTYHMYLDPRKIPFPSELHRQAQELSFTLHDAYQITFPPYNINAVLLRFGAEFGFPPELLLAAKTLLHDLNLPITWPTTASYKHHVSTWPEISIMSSLLVATKLAFGFDSITRTPHTSTEPAAHPPNLTRYSNFLTKYLTQRDALSKDGTVIHHIRVTESDILTMKPAELDAYMDWYEKNWGDTAEAQDLPKQLLDLFPRGREHYNPPSRPPSPLQLDQVEPLPKRRRRKRKTPSPSPSPEPESETEAILSAAAYKDGIPSADLEEMSKSAFKLHDIFTAAPVPAVPSSKEDAESEVLRPGQNYTRYHHDSDLPKLWRLLVMAAAEFIDVTEEDLRKGITSVEVRVEGLVKDVKRGKERWGREKEREDDEEGEVDDEEGEVDDEGQGSGDEGGDEHA